MNSTKCNANAMHSWHHNPFVNFLDIQVWFYLKLLIMSGLEGWWSISPTACLYSPRLTPRFIAEFYKARANAYRLYDSDFDAIGISYFARSYFARTENVERRDIEVEGWLVHSFSSIFDNGKYLADATVYRGSEKTRLLQLACGQIWFESRFDSKCIMQVAEENNFSEAHFTEVLQRIHAVNDSKFDSVPFLSSCTLTTPHARLQSRFPTRDFIEFAKKLKNEWFAIQNRIRKSGFAIREFKPTLRIDGQQRALKELEALKPVTLMRRRVGQVQTLIQHDDSFENIECKRPIGHLLNTIFAESPSPMDLVLNSDKVFNELSPRERALFFTERLPLRRHPRIGQFNYIEEENEPSISLSDFSQDALFNECMGDRPMNSVKRRGGTRNNCLGSLESVPAWVQDYLPRQDLPTNRESRSRDMRSQEMPDVAELTQIADDNGPMS